MAWSTKSKEGDAAFYGPKIDIDVRDAIGRSWQLSTIQADFQLPERFDLEYVGADNDRHRPIMLHRALFGSIERFFGVLLEHYAGNFPTWLAPLQVRVLPVATAHEEYAQKVVERLADAGARVDMIAASDPLGKRIRSSKLDKLPVHPGGRRRRRRRRHRRGQPARRRRRARRRSRRVHRALRRRGCRRLQPGAHGLTDMLERLWNGWRSSYVSSLGPAADAPGQGSPFTQILASGLPDDETNIVHRGPHCFAILNAYPYGTGHLLVLPYREVAGLEDLDEDETRELWATVTDAVVAVTSCVCARWRQRRPQPRPRRGRFGQ